MLWSEQNYFNIEVIFFKYKEIEIRKIQKLMKLLIYVGIISVTIQFLVLFFRLVRW